MTDLTDQDRRAEMAVAYGVLHGKTHDQIVDMLDADGLLAPSPQVIRTVEEQEALDPDTLLMSRKGYLADAEDNIRIPAVVIATGDQVRAARTALEEA